MKEQLESLTLQQLLTIARQYNKKVSVPIPPNVRKDQLVTYIQTHAKDISELLKILADVRGQQKPVLPAVKRDKSMPDEEYEALKRKRERGIRAIERAKAKYEPLEGGEMSKEDSKKYKKEVSELKKRYS